MIVQDLIIDLGLPLSVVDHPAFLRAMNIADPRLTVLSRRTLCRETNLTFLLGPHTGDNLRQRLEDTIAAFDIEDKFVRIATDNASNNLRAFDELVIPGFEVYFEPEDDDVDPVENAEKHAVDRTDLILTACDILSLQEFASVFALYAEATTRAQADKTASISLVAPSILSIYFDLERERTNCEYPGPLCRTLVNSLCERFGRLLERCEIFADSSIKMKKRSTHDLFLIASFLDGRFKFNWILASDLLDSTKERLINTMKTLVLKAALQLHGSLSYISETNMEPSISDHCGTVDESLSNLPNFKRKRLFSGYEGQKASGKKKRSCILESIESEISMFEKEDGDDSSLVLEKKNTYSYLQKLATKRNINASSSWSIIEECAFSTYFIEM
ncbi:unnamed protein product [Adineta ricciae]|uniref:Uncharacterized protein n=1 Tax=Adineta ricciae TaxID=249248 RepID=A0A816BM73_ADIRI|nr:unnamed protein product [Adineta ricciae]